MNKSSGDDVFLTLSLLLLVQIPLLLLHLVLCEESYFIFKNICSLNFITFFPPHL